MELWGLELRCLELWWNGAEYTPVRLGGKSSRRALWLLVVHMGWRGRHRGWGRSWSWGSSHGGRALEELAVLGHELLLHAMELVDSPVLLLHVLLLGTAVELVVRGTTSIAGFTRGLGLIERSRG